MQQAAAPLVNAPGSTPQSFTLHCNSIITLVNNSFSAIICFKVFFYKSAAMPAHRTGGDAMLDGFRIADHSIRWAMIGGGEGSQIGAVHRAAARRDDNFQLLAGVFSHDPQRCRDFGRRLGLDPARCYADVPDMLAAEARRADGIEAVSIATPNAFHYEACRAALEAGLHVVCEKPLCCSVAEAEELAALAERRQCVAVAAYGYACHPMIQQARQMVRSGRLGRIRLINMSFAHGGDSRADERDHRAVPWRSRPEQAGSSFILGDVGTHPLYLTEAMIPDFRIRRLLCTTRSFVPGRRLEDNAFVIMDLAASASVAADAQAYCWASSVNSGARHHHQVRLIGEKASLEWNDACPDQLRYEVDGRPEQILYRGMPYLDAAARSEDRLAPCHPEGLNDAWANLYRRFAAAVTGVEPASDDDFWYPDIRAGVRGVKWVDKCLESARRGSTWVDVAAQEKSR